MSTFRKASQQGNKVVVRDENERIVSHATISKELKLKPSWRKAIKELTDNGTEMILIMLNIARGTPMVHKLPDGRESEPVIPEPELMFNAAKAVHEFMHGKAVAQTEVVKAEQESVLQEQLAAMSNEDLLEAARPLLMAQQKRLELTDEQPNTESDAELTD